MKILIVDDEQLARERLISLVNELDNTHSMLEAEHGLAALGIVTQSSPDVVLLDIRMPVMDGLEAAQHLCQMDEGPAIIFTTAYQDHALAAFDMHAVDYLLKPVRKERLREALERARRLQGNSITEARKQERSPRTHLSANVRGNLKLLPVKDIRYFRAEDKYVIAGWPDGELLLNESLVTLESEFSQYFIRIHRNALVAINYIDGLLKTHDDACEISLRGVSVRLPVSRRNVSEIRKLIRS